MSDWEQHRKIAIGNFSDDGILVMLVEELANWLYTVEQAEAALAALCEDPMNGELRSAFDERTQTFAGLPTEYIDTFSAEKVPASNVSTQIKDIKKLFYQVDLALMFNKTLDEERALSEVRARARGQAEKINVALDSFADTVRAIMGQ